VGLNGTFVEYKISVAFRSTKVQMLKFSTNWDETDYSVGLSGLANWI
jgi:hypothetical protein